MQVCALDCPHDWPHRPSIPNAHVLGGLVCVLEACVCSLPCALPSCSPDRRLRNLRCLEKKSCWAGAVEFFGCCVRAREYEEEEVSEHFLAGRGSCTLWYTAYSLQPDLSGRKKHHERTPLYRAWRAHWTVKGIPSDFYYRDYYQRPRQRQAKAHLPALPAPNLRRDASEAVRSADRPAPRHHPTPVPATSLWRTPVPTCDVLASYYLRLPRNISSFNRLVIGPEHWASRESYRVSLRLDRERFTCFTVDTLKTQRLASALGRRTRLIGVSSDRTHNLRIVVDFTPHALRCFVSFSRRSFGVSRCFFGWLAVYCTYPRIGFGIASSGHWE
jgi:hypothetical protein